MRPSALLPGALFLAIALAGAPAANACGYHDPSSVNLGMLNLAYPDALYVRTAVWAAQLDGALPRNEQAAAGNPEIEKIRAMLRMRATIVRLGALRDRVGAVLGGQPAPAFSVVLIGTMLWTRYEPGGGTLQMDAHTTGPASEDVVIVTDEPVVAALLDGRITPRQARTLGLVRFYGAPQSVEDVESLLDGVAPVKTTSAAGNKIKPRRQTTMRATSLRNPALVAALAGCLALPVVAAEQSDIGTADKATLEKVFPSKPGYSPYAGRNFPTRPLFGDTHLHTSFSMDAGAFGARLGADGRLPLRPGRGGHSLERPAGQAVAAARLPGRGRPLGRHGLLPALARRQAGAAGRPAGPEVVRP